MSFSSATRLCYMYGVPQYEYQEVTLHMGATKTAPSQYSGIFLCKTSARAPPMDSPSKYLIFFLFPFISAKMTTITSSNRFQAFTPLSVKHVESMFDGHHTFWSYRIAERNYSPRTTANPLFPKFHRKLRGMPRKEQFED